jgi:hypothetical protein
MNKNANLEITWPLYDGGPAPSLPKDPNLAVDAYAPPAADLAELAAMTSFPEAADDSSTKARKLRDSLPPGAPEWMRAARALADSLETLIARGTIDRIEQAALARTWAAWSLGGVTENHILRVAHLVSRAHTAIRETTTTTAADLNRAYTAAAGVVHGGLPSAIQARTPFECVVLVVRQLHQEANAWVAVVEGTAELLGWKHYARVHAASVIRAVLERQRPERDA